MTIISDKHKCIFIRIPKTGTSSIEHAFKLNDPGSVSQDDAIPHGHHGWEEVKRMAGDDRWETYFKFCVFREPIDWVTSNVVYGAQYHWDKELYGRMLKKRIDNYVIDHPTIPNSVALKSLETVQVDGLITKEDVDAFINLRKFWNRPANHQFQSDWVPDDIDLVIDFANIESGWAQVKEKLGLDFDIPWINKSEYIEGVDYDLTSPALEYAKEYYEKDIQFYEGICKQ
jgi:hypothetical protein